MTQLLDYAIEDYYYCCAEVAQSVEHGTENPGVPSSILGLGTSKIKESAEWVGSFFIGCYQK